VVAYIGLCWGSLQTYLVFHHLATILCLPVHKIAAFLETSFEFVVAVQVMYPEQS
jgi:hypothetical protein